MRAAEKDKSFRFVFTPAMTASTSITKNEIRSKAPLDDAGITNADDIIVDKNSMPEDDPNGNTLHDAHEIRWGPQHAGAKLLASQYTRGKQEECLACSQERLTLIEQYVTHTDNR